MSADNDNFTMKVDAITSKIIFDKMSDSTDELWQIIPSDTKNVNLWLSSDITKNAFILKSNRGLAINLRAWGI